MGQPAKAIKTIYRQLKRVGDYELNFLVHAGIIKKLKGYAIWEIIIDFNNVCYRIFCVIRNAVLCLVHGFIKKSNRTPAREIKTALSRIRDLDYKLSLAVN